MIARNGYYASYLVDLTTTVEMVLLHVIIPMGRSLKAQDITWERAIAYYT